MGERGERERERERERGGWRWRGPYCTCWLSVLASLRVCSGDSGSGLTGKVKPTELNIGDTDNTPLL